MLFSGRQRRGWQGERRVAAGRRRRRWWYRGRGSDDLGERADELEGHARGGADAGDRAVLLVLVVAAVALCEQVVGLRGQPEDGDGLLARAARDDDEAVGGVPRVGGELPGRRGRFQVCGEFGAGRGLNGGRRRRRRLRGCGDVDRWEVRRSRG